MNSEESKKQPPGSSLQARILGCSTRLGTTPFLTLLDNAGGEQRYTYSELVEQAARWTTLYRNRGFTLGARIVVALPHSKDLYASYLGALLGGFVPAMFAFPSPKLSVQDYLATLGTLIDVTQSDAFVTYPALKPDIAPLLEAKGVSVILSEEAGKLPPAAVFAGAEPSDVAFLQYSSGTTGLKKGVAITQAALLWQVDQYSEAIGIEPDDVIVSWLPLYHDMGLICCFFLPLLAGIPLVAMSPFDWVLRPMMLLEAITRYRGTLCWLPNFAYSHLARHVSSANLSSLDLSAMRGFVNCSEPVLHDSHSVFLEQLAPAGLKEEALASSYAMAENTFAVTSGGFRTPLETDIVDRRQLMKGHAPPTNGEDPFGTRLVSSGSPLPDTTVIILGEDGKVLPNRQIGEITISSPALFESYLASSVPAHRHGYFNSGDLGYMANGHLFVTGRKKDLIIVRGKNVFPQDIETIVNAVSGVIPGRTVAFGVQDSTLGTERIVVLAESHAADPNDISALAAEIREQVAQRTDVAVDDVRIVPHRWLRKSTSGKMARNANKERYLEVLRTDVPEKKIPASDPLPSPDAGRTVSLLNTVLRTVKDVLTAIGKTHSPSLGPDDRLITSGLIDSLTLVTLVINLERATGLTIPPPRLDIGHFDTARAITTLLLDVVGSHADNERLQKENRIVQMDDRDKVCERFIRLNERIDLLILGSSKAKHLSPSVAGQVGFSAFNFWLMSARAEDWYCALRFVLDYGKGPIAAVVLPLDVESFSNAAETDIRLAYSKRLTPYLYESHSSELPLQPTGPACDGDNRFDSVFVQFKLGQGGMLWGSAQPVTERSRRPGGIPSDREPMPLHDPSDRDAQYVLRMAGFTSLDQRRLQYFKDLLHLCFVRGVRVIACISPLHNALDRFLTERTTYAERLDDLIAFIQGNRHPLLSFYDTRVPSRFGGLDDDFENAAHIGMANSDRLLDYLLSQEFAPSNVC